MSDYSRKKTKLPCGCPNENENLIGIEYAYDDPNHYDGVSEWRCKLCNARWNAFNGKLLKEGEVVKGYGA